ncbi:basement membrane-specific heparan sulfate proteoglycan core protein isoform X7 [Condylostylus longicornis]|uniref:basement membrane-specific heparan sulfate proteoglycan core protein isoform X7 n=1 Tax=Condylostylus longicornis TaxID=2530218 RepID=UPI00244DE30B|nr:basement membrane-specific heparan sulfate proteoglycan core protein isoform X7 [Condylostylus longicornis]
MGFFHPQTEFRKRFLIFLMVVQIIGIQLNCYAERFQDTDLVFDDIFENEDNSKNISETITDSKSKLLYDNEKQEIKSDVYLTNELFDISEENDIDNDANANIEFPIEKEDDSQSSSWLVRGVNRVKREISRMLGNNDEGKGRKRNKTNKIENLKKSKKFNKFSKKTTDIDVNVNKDKNSFKKRRDIFDIFNFGDYSKVEGSGNDGDDSETEPLDVNFYRVMFTSRELWSEGFRERASHDFQRLQKQVKNGFEMLFNDNYAHFTDMGYDLEATLVEATQTNDLFKTYLTADLKVKGNVNADDLSDIIENKLNSLELGDLLVQRDENFSFLKISENEFDDPKSIIHRVSSNQCIGGFQCVRSRECISPNQRCDNFQNCQDGSDEENCEDHISHPHPTEYEVNTWENVNTVKENEASGDFGSETESSIGHSSNRCDEIFVCPISGKEICNIQLCDGNQDCPHGEDENEMKCDERGCRDDEFSCDNGSHCVPLYKKCDSYPDCEDYSDESGCETKECRRDEFTCGNGQCIYDSQKCDGYKDCDDGTDEVHCFQELECLPHEMSCDNNTKCILSSQKCDGFAHCTDNSDEFDCERKDCARDQISCDGGSVCISRGQVCDGIFDCKDTSDENNCDEECHHDEFLCRSGHCIQFSQKCDGYDDCGDGSDEIDCIRECRSDEYQCRNGACILRSQLCDNHYDCRDRDDEDNCPNECTSEQYQCHDRSKCISNDQVCDGDEDCPNGDDEENCDEAESYSESNTLVDNSPFEKYVPTYNPKTACKGSSFKCRSSGVCLPMALKCDGAFHCNDKSDEEHCQNITLTTTKSHFQSYKTTKMSDFTKASTTIRTTTIAAPTTKRTTAKYRLSTTTTSYMPITRRMSDWYTDSHFCESGSFPCVDDDQYSIACLFSNLTCNEPLQCSRSITDSAPLCHCYQYKFACLNYGQCIPLKLLCDNKNDCFDGSDEKLCYSEAPHTTPDDCGAEEFYCDHNCFPYYFRCDGIFHCMDKRDETDCQTNVTTTSSPIDVPTRYPCPELTCVNNGKCYKYREKCDGTNDCDDGSDERDCCGSDQFTCSNGICARQCDGRSECPDGADEEGCPYYGCQSYQWRCENGQCINSHSRCDGRHDCDDYSDERGCPHLPPSDPQLNIKTYPSSQIIKERYIREGREVVFRCRDEGPSRAKVKWSRPGGRPLPRGFTDKNGRLEIPNIRVEDSGEYVCEAVGYPAFTRGQSVSVSLTVEKYNPILDRPPSACGYHEATCMNGECIDKNRICDGIPHCSDGSDEHSCSHGRKCSPNQFRCKNSKCVDRIWRCDGENDCGDNSDEESCDPNPSDAPCRHDEFQCRSGHCIPKSFHCDGTNDCRDGTDEVGCVAPAVISPPPPRVDLYPGTALNISCRAVGVPVPLIVWRLNWGHVPEKCESTSQNGLGNLYCPNMQTQDSGAYSCEIINTKGGIFVTPDTIVTVIRDSEDICPAGTFNNLAVRKDECISCFCFGISNQCKSADLYIYALPPPITSHKVVGVEPTPSGIQIGEYEGHNLIKTRHGVQFRVSNVPFSRRQIPYLELPSDYSGNQLKSYGGFIKYTLTYYGHGRTISAPDVIIIGNGYSLAHKSLQPPISNGQTQYNVQFAQGQWEKPDGRLATRSEIMMVLAEVERILIRLEYIDATEREVELTHITIDSAAVDDRGLGSASLVEECTCPTGYMGYSCERCAPGYVRQRSGPWLGRCIPHVIELCPQGQYGDPSHGIACKPCPCPLTNAANNFATGCVSGPDGEPICNCQIGYTGHRCQQCAPGYEGNPMQPGSYCQARPSNECHTDGTQRIRSNGTCECKSSVIGPKCDMCATNSFHLNSYSHSGCIECFCMGVSQTCSSSNYYRDTIRSSFSNTRGSHGFTLVNDYENDKPESFEIRETNDQLIFRGASDTSDVLYWSLPSKFLGDKVTAYGGVLNYTVRFSPLPGGQRSRNVAPDVVIKSQNDIVILHYNKNEISPSVAYTYTIPIVENSWQRNDGVLVNREHLLMALADIEAIYIKATYTTVTQEAALIQVSMDTAIRSNTGQNRAVEVEQCVCPSGYTGLSCEDCAPGYKRSQEHGLYLGICELCECNGHSNECDPESGICINCRDNTIGPQCDQCLPGYEGNSTIGTPHDCVPLGSDHSLCDRCDERGVLNCENNYCHCKPNVEGETCDRCRSGTFNLDHSNPFGCEECFCSGVTSFCTQANFYKEFIPFDFISNKPIISDADGMLVDEDNLDFDIVHNLFTYLTPSYTQKYWSLSGRLLGDQIKSYGGNLEFKLEVESNGHFEPGKDVILMGNGVIIYWSRPPGGENLKNFAIRLTANNQWYRQDTYSSPYPASKTDIMTVLANIDHILIRATPSIPTLKSSLSDVVMETAESSGIKPALIEFCSCPEGYEGTSCENCSPLFYRNISQTDKGYFGACQPCHTWCTDQTESCEMSGTGYVKCHCKQGYSGDRCQYGFKDGQDINKTTTSPCCNQYVVKWNKKPIVYDKYYIYDKNKIKSGELFFAKNCSRSHLGKPSPSIPHTEKPQAIIEVRIDSPTLSIIPVGGSLTLTCRAIMLATRAPINVKWLKLEDNLPYDAEQSNGILRLYNLQVHDSGVYVCQAQSGNEVVEEQIPINVGRSEPTDAPTIRIRPENIIEAEEFQPVEAICEAYGNPTPNVQWTRIDKQMSSDIEIENERLYISSIQRSDEGSYRCTAYNQFGRSEESLQIYVKSTQPNNLLPPLQDIVVVEPPSYNARTGEKITLLCELRKQFIVEYEWLKDDNKLYKNQNIIINGNELTIRKAAPHDTGNYICRVIDQSNGDTYSSTSYVHVEATDEFPHGKDDEVHVRPLQEKYVVVQGQDLDITCEASGANRPIIKWTRLHEQLDSSIQIRDNTLSIKNAQPHHRGLYICIAEGPSGTTSEAHTIIDVEPRERPQVEIYPTEPQEVRIGDRAILDCRTVAGIPEPRISWRRTDGLPLSSQIKEEYQGRLIINNIKEEDAGTYECIAENLAGKAIGSTSLIIVQPAQITLVPNTTELHLTEGEELKLLCIASGIPPPKVKWTLDQSFNQHSEASISQAEIYIPKTSLNDAKLYTCEAENSGGNDIRYINVRIERRRGDTGIHDVVEPTTHRYPVRPTFTPSNLETHPVEIGERATLSCNTIDEQNRDASLRTFWTRVDGRPLPTNSLTQGNDLILFDINYDSVGVYRCNVIGPNGNPIHYFDANVIISDLPHITLSPEMPMTVRLGETVDVYCNVSGAQPIRVEWHAESRRPMPPSVRAEGPYLRFHSIKYSDAGRYYCTAANLLGNATKVAEVIVNRGETIYDRPPAHITRHEIQEGQDVKLNCDLPAQPGLTYLWQKEHGALPQSAYENNNILLLRQVSIHDEGRYICKVISPDNGIITQTSVELIVKRRSSKSEIYCMIFYICTDYETSMVITPSGYTCNSYDFKCKSHPRTCIHPNRICDGIYDCIDHSDELECNRRNKPQKILAVTKKSKTTTFEISHKKNIKKVNSRHKRWRPDQLSKNKKSATRPENVHTLPILKLDQQEAYLKVGESTEVECQSFDKRYPVVIWERADGRPLPRNVKQIGNKLIAQNVDQNSAGSYVCKCKTDEGDLYTTSFELRIEEEELRPRRRPRTQHAKVESNAILKCDADNYPLSVRWSRQHGHIKHGTDIHSMEIKLNNVQASDAGTYICTLTQNGESIDQPIILVVTGSIPQFSQNPLSYMSFPTLESPYMKFNFEITFKPAQPNGLILYNGQKKASGDYISLSLNDRYPEFRFDFGTKPTIVKSEKPISLNEWHSIKVSRIRRDGYLIVDEQTPIAFPPVQTAGLDLVEDLYIGAVPKWEDLAPNATETKTGFVGCISQLVLQDRPVELIKEAKLKEGITSCQPCADKPCENGGICLESQTATGYLCVCDDGFTGKTCAIVGDKCTPGICGPGRCQDTDFGIACFCPLNKTGDRCQYNEHLDGSVLSFKDGSYAAYKTPRPSKLNIKFSVKPNNLEDSVILYVAESERANGDFFAVLLKNKRIELRINTGARVKPVIVTSQNEIEANKWTEVEVGRRVGEGILKVGNELEQTGKQAGPARSLYLKTHLFIGGYDKRILLNRDIDIHRGFDGCISMLEESSRKINLIADLLDAANIQNCGDNNEIFYQPPTHQITPGRPNNDEINKQNACVSDPCENYGTCILLPGNNYKCHCPLGYSGNNCHEHVQLDTNCQFNGDGYLELNRSVFSEKEHQLESFIAMLFSTKHPNGLLVWWGQPKDMQYNGQDFIALAINEGILEFSFRLDGEENTVQSAYTKVDDGSRHIAIIKRYGNEVSLELDHLIEHGETKRPTLRNTMILPGNVFIGGAPNLGEFTGNRYPTGFVGCVRVVETDEGGPVNLGQHAVSALNVDVCPSWIPWNLVNIDYDILKSDFGTHFDPNSFDKIEEPPPVHIIYPQHHPTFRDYQHNKTCNINFNSCIILCYISFYVILISKNFIFFIR